jgi:hypothetical protein
MGWCRTSPTKSPAQTQKVTATNNLTCHSGLRFFFPLCGPQLQASVPMTKTGFYDCTCRAKSKAERDKWVAMLQRILPQQKMSTELQMSCFMEE